MVFNSELACVFFFCYIDEEIKVAMLQLYLFSLSLSLSLKKKKKILMSL